MSNRIRRPNKGSVVNASCRISLLAMPSNLLPVNPQWLRLFATPKTVNANRVLCRAENKILAIDGIPVESA
jgi:hypothetical protein